MVITGGSPARSFTVSGRDAGREGVHVMPGVDGLFDIPVELHSTKIGVRDGERFEATRYKPRVLQMVFSVSEGDGTTSGAVLRNFTRVLTRHHSVTVTLSEDERGGPLYSLKTRVTHVRVNTEMDPSMGDTDYLVTAVLEASDPFYYGEPYVQEVLFTRAGNKIVQLSQSQLGDVPSYPAFELDGGSQWDIQMLPYMNRFVRFPRVPAGHSLRVSFDPAERQVVSSDGSNVWGKMNGVRVWHSVAPGESVTFRINPVDLTSGRMVARVIIPAKFLFPVIGV